MTDGSPTAAVIRFLGVQVPISCGLRCAFVGLDRNVAPRVWLRHTSFLASGSQAEGSWEPISSPDHSEHRDVWPSRSPGPAYKNAYMSSASGTIGFSAAYHTRTSLDFPAKHLLTNRCTSKSATKVLWTTCRAFLLALNSPLAPSFLVTQNSPT
jgi:hypothetical protein